MARKYGCIRFSAAALAKALGLNDADISSVEFNNDRRVVNIYVSTDKPTDINGMTEPGEGMEVRGPGVIVKDEVERPATINYQK